MPPGPPSLTGSAPVTPPAGQEPGQSCWMTDPDQARQHHPGACEQCCVSGPTGGADELVKALPRLLSCPLPELPRQPSRCRVGPTAGLPTPMCFAGHLGNASGREWAVVRRATGWKRGPPESEPLLRRAEDHPNIMNTVAVTLEPLLGPARARPDLILTRSVRRPGLPSRPCHSSPRL